MKINEAYSKFKDLSMNITYKVYLNQKTTVPYETQVGIFKQHGNLRYSKLSNIESIENKDYLLVVDNDDKRIVISNPVKFNPGKITMLNLDSAFRTCSTVVPFTSGALQGYQLVFKTDVVSAFDKIDLYFNKKTYIVEKLVFYYRQKMKLINDDKESAEKPKMEILFSQFNFQNITDVSLFSESKYIEKKKGGYIPVNAYTSYNVINQKIAK